MAEISATTTLTSKGQMTLPKVVRESVGLKSGDCLDVAVENGRIILTPRRVLHINDICSRLPKPARTSSIAEMERGIEEGATKP